MRRYYRRKVYKCGNYIDVQVYPVFASQKGRGAKRKTTSETQARLNTENSKRKLLRLVHTNFKENDYFVTLTYDNEHIPEDIDAAKKDIQNFFRRAKRLYSKSDIEMKYIWLVEHGKKSGKIHFHVFMTSGVDRTILEGIWKNGYCNTRALKFKEDGIAGLVYYVTKDESLLYKRWAGSRNLKKPAESQNDFVVSQKGARYLYESILCDDIRQIKSIYPNWQSEFKNYDISAARACKNEVNGEFYITLNLHNKDVVFRI